MKARSDGSVIVRVEVVKKLIVTAVLALTIPFGAMTIACGQVVVAMLDMCINFGANRRFSGYTWSTFFVDVLPVVAVVLLMYMAVWCVDCALLQWAVGARLALKIVVGVVVYVLLSWGFNLTQWREVVQTLSKR
jgi:hypothetical protein